MAQEYTDYSIFVGDLAPEVDDGMLEQHFRTYYPTVKQAKVMIDQATGRSRGFGFVRFTSEADRDRAIQEVNGTYIGSKPVRCSLATQKPRPGGGSVVAPPHTTGGPSGGGSSHASTATTTTGRRDDAGDAGPPNNTTLFIGGLSSSVSEAELHAAFARCGEIVYVKIPPGKGCGFVQFVTRTAAEFALETMNGLPLGGMPIRVSWGKSTKAPGGPHYPSGGHPHAPPGPAYGAPGYGYGAGYDPYAPAAYGGYGYAMDPYGYGYAAAADPYAGYPGYAAHAGPAHPAAHPAAAAANAAAAAAAAHAGATSHGAPAAVQPMLYDPLVPLDVAKMNMAYMHRHVPVLTGAYVRVPIAMAPVAPHQMPMQVRPVHHDVS